MHHDVLVCFLRNQLYRLSVGMHIIGFDRRSQNGRSDDVTSGRTIRDVSIAAHCNGDDAPGEGRQSAEIHEGILTHRAASPSPELNHWVNSADTHMSEPL